MAELTINKLIKRYGGNTILEFDEWKVNEGCYWIKGGNGKGKTTLFKIIAGQTPFSGTVALNDIFLHKQPVSYRSGISYAEAEPLYPDFLTGTELLDYVIAIRKADRQSAAEITRLFKMDTFMHHQTGTYSSGMLKKLSLILAFTGTIQLYILDEPFITIDKEAAAILYQLINNQIQQGKTILISSHQDIDPALITLSGIFEIDNQRMLTC